MDCVAAGVPPDGGELGELFPLQVGKAVSFTRRWAGEAWQDRIEVLANERVTGPAGTFDAFVLLRVSEQVNSDWRPEQGAGFAPDQGWVGRLEGVNTKGGGARLPEVSFSIVGHSRAAANKHTQIQTKNPYTTRKEM